MAHVALVPHRLRPLARELATQAIAWLEQRGHEARVPGTEARLLGLHGHACPDEKLADGLDLAVSLGGDGTMLRTVELVVSAGVPVLGVNVGNLGYLNEIEPGGFEASMERFLAGEHRIEQRMTLDVEVLGRAEPLARFALNEAVLQRTASGHAMRVALAVNGRRFFTCAADGFIVATPTGSTAYSFSAGGPIVSPRHRAIVATPVSAHTLFDRSLVLASDESVDVEVLPHVAAELVVDGHTLGMVEPGETLSCREGRHPALFVSFGRNEFHDVLKAKFGLADG